MALKLSGSISLTGSLASNSSIAATVVSSSFFTGSYLDSLGNSGSADEILISDGRGGSTYKAVVLEENTSVQRAVANKFSISWQDNLNFTASATSVYIPGEETPRSQLGEKNITLAAADSTHPRFDVFIFSGSATDPSSGSVEVVQGTASENPIYPDIDSSNEVPLKFILLKAGASVPSDGSDENNTDGADFVGSSLFSDNANDGNSWKSFGTSAASANISSSVAGLGASYYDQFDYGNTTYGNALKWPRVGSFEQDASNSKKDKFGFWHPDYNVEGSGLTLGTLDAIEFDLKLPSSATGSDWWTIYVKEGRQLAYFQFYLAEAQRRNSNGTINRTAPAAYARINFRDYVDFTRDDFQKVSIPANNFQGTGDGGAGSKIIFIYAYLKKSFQYQGPLASAGDGIYIKNLRWVDGSGAAPTSEPTGKVTSQASAAAPTVLSGKQNTLSSTAVSSVIVSGENNKVTTKRSFIGSGRSNLITGNTDSVIGGGSFNSSSNSCTFIGGGSNNIVTGSGTNAVIVGGNLNTGSRAGSFIGGGEKNHVSSSYSSIVGGQCNYILGTGGFGCWNIIGGGFFNRILNSSCRSGILGGTNNTITGTDSSFIIGTSLVGTADCTTYMNNLDVEGTVSGSTFSGSFVGDGSGLTGISGGGGSADNDWGDAGTYISSSKGISVTGGITGSALTIGNNHTTVGGSALASILAGSTNCLSASNYSAIIGGAINRVKTSPASTITHGCSNCVSGSGQSIVGGRSNCAMDADCVGVLSGFCNLISGSNWNVIGGGYQNNICRTTYGAGGNNIIGSGQENCITGGGSWTGYATFIGAGRYNTGSGNSSAIGAGMNNSVSQGDRNFIGAGFCNCIYNSGDNNFIGSGELNKINSNATGSNIIVGGCQNCVVGTFGTVVGGRQNCITHKDSFVAGTCITSSAENTFYVNNLFSTGSDGSNNVVIFANLPTSDPTNAGQLWNDSGTLKISAG